MVFMNNKLYDVLIIGSGPAGLTASIYASRYKLNNLVIGKVPGGTITLAHKVENFPAFSGTGFELGQRIVEQAMGLGAEMVGEEVARIEIIRDGSHPPSPLDLARGFGGARESFTSPRLFRVVTEMNKEFEARAVIVATGTERRKLGVPGEKEYLGKGVSYCTNCDAPFFKDKTVALIGGSNAAVGGAVHAAEFASKVYIICRKDELRAEPVWIEEATHNPKIEVIFNTNVTKILGVGEIGGVGVVGERVEGVELDKEFKGNKVLPVDGVFVEIGGVPASSFLRPLGVELDENDFIKVNEKMETNIPGLFAAGDVTTHSLVMSQAIVSCADGAIAAGMAYKYSKGIKAPKLTEGQ